MIHSNFDYGDTISILRMHEIYSFLRESDGMPEEVDAKCIEYLGMRFQRLMELLAEVAMRRTLANAGHAEKMFDYFPAVTIDGELIHKSREEYDAFIKDVDTFADNSSKTHEFSQFLLTYAASKGYHFKQN